MTVSTTTNKVSYSGNGSQTVFAYTFKIFADGDLDVYIRDTNGTETLQTITTNYTVSGAGADAGGNVTFVTAPGSTDTVVIQRKLDLTQGTDYVANDPFPAESHEDALDRLTFITQQIQEEVDRSIKASVTNTISSTEFAISATDRANKIFAFDASGDLAVTQEIGTFRGNWAASTAYNQRDLVKDTSTNNIFIVNTSHTSSGAQPLTTNANSAKYDLIVDAASATTSASSASSSATAAASSATAAAASATAAAADAVSTAADVVSTNADVVTTNNNVTAAQTAQAAAEAALDTFDDRFLGAKSSDPTLDNDGNALIDGALYFDTTNDLMKVYDLTNTQWRQLALTGSNQTNVNTVAGQISPTNNIATVAGAATNIGTVATDLSGSNNIGAVAGAITNVNNVGGSIANVNTVASNLTNVNAFANTYFISATAPASPTEGDLWFDTTNDVMKVYDGSGFVNAGSSVNGTSNRTTYTATAGQTSFAATYDAGFVDVYLNGVKLINGTDFTATNGSTVVLTTGAAVNDTVDIVGYGTFELQNTSLDDLSDVSSASASTGQFLKWNGTNWVGDTVSTDVVADSSPQLGGDLDLNSNNITGTGNISTTGNATFTGSITVGDGHTIGNDGNDNLTLTSSTAENIKYDAGGGNHLFLNNGTETARLTDAGLMGIGTTAPNRALTVNHSNGTVAEFKSSSASGGGISLADGATTANNVRIRAIADDMYFYAGGDQILNLRESGTVRVGDGSVVSGSTRFTIYGDSANTGRAADTYRRTTTGTNHIQNWYSDVSGTQTIQAVIEAGGDVESRTNNFTGTSDRTLKENITDANSQWDDIKALQVKNYNFIGEPERTCIGVIAQDVEAAGMTGLVKTSDETGKMSVKYSVLYMKAVKALQEAMQKIENLETRVAELEAN